MKRATRVCAWLIACTLTGSTLAQNAPDLWTLKSSGFIMGPGDGSYPVHKSWMQFTSVMKNIKGFDNYIAKMVQVLCSKQDNRSILFVGEPTNTFRYIWARMASANLPADCPNPYWQVEVNQSLIESGNMWVGSVEQYWMDKILEPVEGKDAVLYFGNLAQIVGLGSHSNNDDGIETELVQNIELGRMRAVAFINNYDYNTMKASRHAYVVNSFTETILIEPVEKAVAEEMTKEYFKVFGPNLTVDEKTFKYLSRVSDYYQPNVAEPYRTLRLAQSIVRQNPPTEEIVTGETPAVSTPNPYDATADLEFTIDVPAFKKISISFSRFALEDGDKLTVYDGHTGSRITNFFGSGPLGDYWFDTNKIKLVLTTDDDENTDLGFEVGSLKGKRDVTVPVTHEHVRNAIFEIVQVPRWMLDRDYSIVRELEGKLEGDVVGVKDGKRDLVRLAKNGYVAGRTDEKPVGSALLVGPTGTGKSYIAKKFAEFLNMKMITIDMTSYRSIESFDRFVDTVANHLIVNPYAVYLFEEIDKADTSVLDRLFFMLDEGLFYDKGQRPLFARGAFILMTTNAGDELIIKERNNPELPDMVDLALQKVFRPSFLNRFDARSIFVPFTSAEYQQLAKIMVKKKISLMKEYFGWEVEVDAETTQFLGEFGQSPVYGARPMERLVENTISIGIAEYQINVGNVMDGDRIQIKKMAGEKNNFMIVVNDDKSMRYTVDVENNSGSPDGSDKGFAVSPSMLSRMSKESRNIMIELLKVFKGNR